MFTESLNLNSEFEESSSCEMIDRLREEEVDWSGHFSTSTF